MPDGKPANEFAFDAKPKNREFAIDIIKTLHGQWKDLMAREMGPDGLSRACTVYECSSKMTQDDANATLEGEASAGEDCPLQDSVDKWHYVKL